MFALIKFKFQLSKFDLHICYHVVVSQILDNVKLTAVT